MATRNILDDWLAFQSTIDTLDNIDGALHQYATQLVDQLRRDVPKDSKDLMKSIKFSADRFGFRLEMLEYGFYQNYGVNPKPSTLANTTNSPTSPENPYGVSDPINVGPFKYKTREFGLAARPFFNLGQIQRDLVALVEQQIENQEE